jgi:putative restriction endonuclease
LPLSIRTSSEGPYDDHFGADDTLVYSYRGTNPDHPENVALRRAMQRQVPLAYFHSVVRGRYLAVWPAFIVGDDPARLIFRVVADRGDSLPRPSMPDGSLRVSYTPDAELRRRYATIDVRHRLHQRGFRERVLTAYREQCALCRLRHAELLDAAHIIPDNEPGGDPVVPNGLALCRLHHSAFDAFFIGIRPDYTVEVHQSIRDEADGPMLRVGLQGIHNQRILTPAAQHLRPDRDRLERRYELFRKKDDEADADRCRRH